MLQNKLQAGLHRHRQALCSKLLKATFPAASSAVTGNAQRRPISTGAAAVTGPLHFLEGRRVQPGNTDPADDITVLGPATGTPLCVMRGSGKEDVDAAVHSARAAFKLWSKTSFKERATVLLKTAQLIRENCEELSRTETLHNGKPLWESRADTEACADTVEFFAGLTNTVAGRHVGFPGHSFGYTRREPLGVIGAIGAFNFPFQMATWKSAPALCTGNTVVFKSSPLTPLTAVMLGEIYAEAGLPPGCFNVIQGEVKPGQLLAHHPDVAKMTFTGSVATGTKVMEACAQDIKKVTLELGGKSPVLIFADCDIDNAVKGTMLANFCTQGQVCSNGTRVYVHKSIKDKFLSQLVERTKRITVGDPMDEKTLSGAMISRAQAEKTLRYIDIAKKEGGVVLCGGERVMQPGELSGGWYLSPCVITDVLDHMTVAREEIFGPVVSVLEFEDEEDVIRRANDSKFGLASGVFTKDLQRAHRVAEQLEAGNVYINNYNVYPPEMPFGGYKQSGMGVECGVECLAYFTQNKTVYVEGGDVVSPF